MKTETFDPENFTLKVDYSKTLEEMIEAGKYDSKNDDFTAKNFPITKGENNINCRLFHFNRCISSDDAIKEMDKAGYRPATQAELLALGASYHELQRQFPIVALGSLFRGFIGHRYVSYLGFYGSKRHLCLQNFESDLRGYFRFLAVKKSTPKSMMNQVDSYPEEKNKRF